MAAREYQDEIAKIDITLKSIEQVLNLPKLITTANELEQQASAPNLWDDPVKAQVVTSKLSRAQSTINKISSIRTRLDDLPVMIELAGSESDKASAFKDIDKELDDLTRVIIELEVQTLLSGEYDERDALMTIRSEAGGVEAADWAQMLMRMYFRFCERHNYKIDVLETSYAEEAGIKSTTFRISAPYAYGRLSVEQGTHRLVRISPFDSQSRRHTSFAGVEVVPVVELVLELGLIRLAVTSPNPIAVPISSREDDVANGSLFEHLDRRLVVALMVSLKPHGDCEFLVLGNLVGCSFDCEQE